jgi:hypothetical protein
VTQFLLIGVLKVSLAQNISYVIMLTLGARGGCRSCPALRMALNVGTNDCLQLSVLCREDPTHTSYSFYYRKEKEEH